MKKKVVLVLLLCLTIYLLPLIHIPVYSAESNYVWPVPGIYTLSSYFNRPSYPNHNAIDINNCNGKEVVATKSGYLYVRNNTCIGLRGHLNLLLVKHMKIQVGMILH